MKKKIIRVLSIVLMLILSLSTAIGCNRDTAGSGPQIDETKTQLNIGMWPGAYEEGISLETAKRFEEKYAEHSFEQGKKGVQVMFNGSANYKASVMTGNFSQYNEDIYFLPESTYYDHIKGGQGDFLEITDVVNSAYSYDFVTKSTITGQESGAVKDKMYESDLQWMNVGTKTEPKYYAMPMYQSYFGIWYDVALFEENGWFFRSNADNSALINKNDPNPTKSTGPDGVSGTYDDGLPATYAQFIKLCTIIRNASVTPIIWSGKYADYFNDFLTALFADYCGLEQLQTLVKFDGEHDIITGWDGDTPTIKTETITQDNAYLAYEDSAAKYYTIKFAEELLTTQVSGKKLYYNEADYANLSHTGAQTKFVGGKYVGAPCAMFIDGSYWWYESHQARDGVDGITNRYKLTDDDYQFGLLPMPKATQEKIGEKMTVINGNFVLCISRYMDPAKIDLAKAFLQFITEEQSLIEFFDRYTCLMQYKINWNKDSDIYKNASVLGKSVLDASKDIDIFTALDSNEKYRGLASTISPNVNLYSNMSPVYEFTSLTPSYNAKSMFEALDYKAIFGVNN